MANDDPIRRVLEICDEALALSPGRRDAYLAEACGDSSRLRASVDSVLVAIGEAETFLDTADGGNDGSAPYVGQRIGAYTLTRPLGEGGMGAVYLAERVEADFTQQVAVKLIRGNLLAAELVERFNAERQILASLNHPYIARMIDGGRTPEGLPYLVMEYVEGEPIDRYCDTANLSIRDRLELVRKVAMAVQSAHQNLVVHRDLKPSNVLVTADGIPKLLDFGIAKLIQPSDGASGQTTRFGSAAMTPDYASPEQILDGKVTTASDVYSLGVLTYQLLTGDRPYTITGSNHREIVRSVEALTVPRPSTRLRSRSTDPGIEKIAADRATTPARLAKLVEGDLDTVLMKALHREADRRYPSIGAFADDLGRFISGQPVEARGDSFAYRVRCFVGRNRLAVIAASLVFVALIAGLAGTSWAYLRAERARAEADQRFDQVRSIAKTMMFDVYEEIERVPGTGSAREMLATTAQSYLATLADDSTSPEVQLEAAQGYSRLAVVTGRQAVSDGATRDVSRESSERAFELLEQLTRSHPEPHRIYRALGQAHSELGHDLLYVNNEAETARAEFELALDAFREAERLDPDQLAYTTERVKAERHIADTFKWQTDYATAIARLGLTIEEVETLRGPHGDDAELLRIHAALYNLRGECHQFADSVDPAIEDFRRAVELLDEHIAANGPDSRIDDDLIIIWWSLANTLSLREEYASAVVEYDRAIAKLEVQLERDPEDRSAQRRQVIIKSSKADALLRMGDVEAGLSAMYEANAWFEAQVEADDTPGSHRSLAVSYFITGDFHANADQEPRACEWYRRALDKWAEIDERFGISEFDSGEPDRIRARLDAC